MSIYQYARIYRFGTAAELCGVHLGVLALTSQAFVRATAAQGSGTVSAAGRWPAGHRIRRGGGEDC